MERAHSGDDGTGSLDDLVVVVEVTESGPVRVVDAGVRSTDPIALPGTTVQVDRPLLSAVATDDDVRAVWASRRAHRHVAEVEGARYDVQITPLASGEGDRVVVHAVAHHRPERMRNVVNAAILDALPTAVALLDADSVVRSVNAAWVRYTLERPDDPLAVHPGEPFRSVLDRALAADPAFATTAEALRSVLDGAVDLASVDHPPEGTNSGEWYTLRAVPVDIDDEQWTVLALDEVSALRHALERWHSTFSGAAVPTVIIDDAGRIADANSAFAELVGVELRSTIGRSALDFVHPADAALVEDRVTAASDRGLDTTPVELRIVRSDGAVLAVQAYPSVTDPGLRRGAVVQLVDRTEQRHAEERLALHRELLELVAAGTPLNDVAMAVALNIGRAVDRATGAVVLPGWAPFVAPGSRAEDLAGGWSVPVDRARLDRGEIVVHTPAPEPRPADRDAAELLASVVRLALQRDETAGASLAGRDALGDLPTADVFLEELGRALEWAAPRKAVAVVAVAPRRIEAGGWRGATTALAELTAFVRGAVPVPLLVARRARHLLVLFQVADRRTVDEVLRELEQRDNTAVGVAIAADGTEDGGALVEEAEEALAAAQLATDEDAAAADLRRGIDAGEVTVHYQPIVDLRTGATVSLEALVRWQHPTRGFVPPPELIHTAETCGLVHEIGALVLTTSCRDLVTFKAAGANVSVAVNLSARQLAEPELVPLVRDSLAAAALDPSSLVVEITESVLVDDVDVVAGALAALRDLGVKVAIDDFGTGYSSLLYLKRFPADVLKVDQSFVQGLGVHEGDTAIVDAVVGLGHRLGLEIVAEGVETGEQLAELRRRRCDQAQGDLLQPPAAATEVAEFLGRGALALGPEPEAPAESELGVDELLSVVTHELSTPLAVIGGHAELLAESLRTGDDRPSAIVDAIERNIKHLDELLRSLSGLGHAFGDPDPRAVVDLGPFVDQVVRELGPLLAHHHVRLDVPTSPVTAEVEPVAVRQVLTNLLSNAAKFTAPGTVIDVTVRRGPGRHEIVVADHGPGVPPARAHELFGRFARLGATARGLGLGLHLSRTLARRQAGDLVHEPTPGGGATFVLRLPA